METQHHNKRISSGNDGHGGIHVCHKCGWQFPKAHPSARHRRAHKKVCGTIEGYKLDNVDDSQGDKVHVDGSDGEHVSDDEHKTPSEKVMQSTISRRSSSGVGSRSSRSIRSDDEVFADADTEFNESPAPVTSQASGGLERYYSMQNVNESEQTKRAEESPIADNFCTPETDLLKDDQLQFLQTFEGEHKIETGVVLQDYSSTNPTLLPESVTVKNESAVEQNVMQFSEPSSELNVAAGGGKEILSSGELSGPSSLNSGTGEEVAVSKVAKEEFTDTVSVGVVSLTGPDLIGVEGNIERSCEEELPGKDKIANIANIHEVHSTGNFYSPVYEGQVTDSGNANSRKSDVIEELNSNVGTDDYICSVAVPDTLPLPEHPIIASEDIDHERGKFHNLRVEDSTLSAESPEYSRPNAMKESDTGFDLTKIVDDHCVSLEDTDLDKNVPVMKDMHDQASDGVNESSEEVRASRNKSFEIEVSCSEVQEVIPLSENVSTYGCAMDGGHIQETTSNVDAKTMNTVMDDREQYVLPESDAIKVSEDDLTVRDWFGEHAINEVPLQVKEQMSIHESNDMADDKNIKLKGAVLNGNNMSSDEERENEYVSSKTEPACGMNIAVSHDSTSEAEKHDQISEVSKLDKKSDSQNLIAHHPLTESLEVSSCVREIVGTGKNVTQGECLDEKGTEGVVRSVDYADNLEVGEDVESSLRSSSGLDDCSTEKEGDRVTKPHVAVSGVDAVVDTGSQADSLDGNWGSVSVMSAASDAQPATDTPSNYSQAMVRDEAVRSEPKPFTENQNVQSQKSVEPLVGTKTMAGASEIQTSNEQQEKSNEPPKGKSDEEIIEKVSNWSAGKQQHTALKTLLGEATAKSRAESPLHHNHSSTPETKTGEIPVTNNSFSTKTQDTTLSSKNPEKEADQEEIGKEWNSPARYPVNIKTEKRKAKSRPWTPFLCCSSVNAR